MSLAASANATAMLSAMSAVQSQSPHPNFIHLAGLVCEAVLEVVFVALPGFLVAWSGMFDTESQKFVAELNTMVFTPCLIFTKLASQLNAAKLADLAVIPFIFVAQTLVSWMAAEAMARLFGFGRMKRQKNFIIAMGVFGNSNSLPISLVLSLSQTISGLHWNRVPGDNDDEVGARGILYLMIFQQLGQLLRWTWGYSVLLKPASAYDDDDEEESRARAEHEGVMEQGRYRDDPEDEMWLNGHREHRKVTDSGFGSGSPTPYTSSISSDSSSDSCELDAGAAPGVADDHPDAPLTGARTPAGRLEHRSRSTNQMTIFPNFSNTSASKPDRPPSGWKARYHQLRSAALSSLQSLGHALFTNLQRLFRRFPTPVQKFLSILYDFTARFLRAFWRQMNPPLWAMLCALIVASVPALQHLFFSPGTLVSNSVTGAIRQSGGVAVPLILVVLGANLARSTLPKEQLPSTPREHAEERRLLCAALLARMVLPVIVMAPVLALIAKFVPVSILADPIFIIVCFLLTGAPSALQLAQICQINGVFMGAMSNLLVASYVVAIFPSTLLLVLLALEVVQWSGV